MTHTQLYATATPSKAMSVAAAYEQHLGSKALPPELFVGTAPLSFGAGLLSFGIDRGVGRVIGRIIGHRPPDCGLARRGRRSGPRRPERTEGGPDAAAARRFDGTHGRSALLFTARHSPPIFIDFISFSIGLGSTA